MNSAVENRWIDFNRDLEGVVSCMYADKKGLITTAMGNLIDPIGAALVLAWKLPDGSLAPRADAIAAWHTIKDDPVCAKRGWTYAAKRSTLRLDAEDIHALIFSKLRKHDRTFAARFSDWEDRPEDAQLAVHSMAWAMGSNFWDKFPKFLRAFTHEDYQTAADECKIMPEEGTVIRRNELNEELLLSCS